MAITPEEIKSDKDIVINFFGDMEIITQDGVWKEHDFNSPKSSRAVAYVMLQRKTAHSPLAIADALHPEDTADVDTIASYDEMTNEERNALLKEILKKIGYKKEANGQIEIDLYPRLPKI